MAYGQGPQGKWAPHVTAMTTNERLALSVGDLDGVVLRYGMFYGADVPKMVGMLRKRRLPIPEKTENRLPWIHIDDAAAATVLAITSEKAGGIYNIVDDLPCSWADFFSEMAEVFNAPAPMALPSWIIRMAAPYVGALVLDTNMRVSNSKAKRELGWQPSYPTYREGIAALAA